ncbi:MAG: hypothetical protein LC674_02485 [Actinobacteria bacterium]|nr:hypothetical protein [Actinomycetota bacterium]
MTPLTRDFGVGSRILASRVGSLAPLISGILVWAAIAAVFLGAWYPPLGVIGRWILGLYIGVLVAMAFGLMVVAPGVLAAKEFFEAVSGDRSEPWNRRLALIWSGGAGALLSLLLAAAFALIALGIITGVKLWFISLCWLVLMVPWSLAALLAHRFLQRRAAHAAEGKPDASRHGA